MKHQNGKGDKYRPVNLKKWEENYDLAFRKRKTVAEWAEHFGDRIKSFDGFREYNHDDLLTEKEYQNGLPHCTMYVKLRKCECGYGKTCPWVVDGITENAFEVGDEWADNWSNKIEKLEKEIQETLKTALNNWADQTNNQTSLE